MLRAQLGVHSNEDTVGCLSLAAVAGHGITVNEIRTVVLIKLDPRDHFQAQAHAHAVSADQHEGHH